MGYSPQPVVLVASSEFTLKSAPVRRTLEQRLMGDLKVSLRGAGIEGFEAEKHAARIVIRGVKDPHSAAQVCAKVFGVAYAAPAVLVPASINNVTRAIVELANDTIKAGESFAIRAHRSAPSQLSRREIEIRGGSEVLSNLSDRGVKVDLSHPDVTVSVDFAGERAYVYASKIQGPDGLPLSSQWRLLALLDSGVLTILSAYVMMRRGCLVELLIPVSDTLLTFSRESQLRLARKLREFVSRPIYRAFIMDLDTMGTETPNRPESPSTKRSLLQTFCLEFAQSRRFAGVIFSNVGGEVTYEGSLPGKRVMPVFYPLIGFDRQELMDLSKLTGLPETELFFQLEFEKRMASLRGEPVGMSEQVTPVVEQISL